MKMEAASLHKKKTGISKGKIKKTIKNVLCRPDPLFWPLLKEEHKNTLESALEACKINIPEFKKPHWNEIKSLPKEQRPKQPKIKKVNGLLFGITECKNALENSTCIAVIVESTLNPRIIAQPLIESCLDKNVPFICLDSLRKLTVVNFGIPTSCLGLKQDCAEDLRNTIFNIVQHYKPLESHIDKTDKIQISSTKVDDTKVKQEVENVEKLIHPYLYRNSKKTRVFNPSLEEQKPKKAFVGQDFIEFTEDSTQKLDKRKSYMTMILKKMSNNQNRVKRK